MFSRVRLTLTLLYSGVFLACFWAFSAGLYIWMERSFEVEIGEQLKQTVPGGVDLGELVIDINEQALDQLFSILVALNVLLLALIPALSWLLTGRTLAPIQRAHEAQRQFVADAAHELRTPLAIIGSEIEIALRQKRPAPEYRAALASSHEEIIRLSALAERLLFLARNDDGSTPLAAGSVDLVDLIGETLAGHQPLLRQKCQRLTFVPPEDSVAVRGDPVLLRRLFANLVDNAIKYTPEGGAITVTLAAAKAMARVAIADTGIGIAPELHGQVFARFTRADVSRGETKGFGLGLAIARAIAERHGGAIAVASVPGQGSTFTVTLPLL